MLSSVFRQTKKVPSILCLTVLLTVCSAPTASAGDLDTVRARGTLRMISWPHQESQFIRRMIEEYGKDGLNRFTGIDVELVRGFAAELGVELEVIPAKDSFSGIFPALQSGQGDLAASSLTITPSRQALFDFSTPYYLERMVVVVPKASTIASVEDLNNKRGAVVTGSSHDQRLRRLAPPGLEVVEVDYTLEALETVQSGKADFALVDSGTIKTSTAKYFEIKEQLRTAFSFPDEEAYGVAVRKGSDLLPRLNTYIERLKASGELDRIITSYNM